MASELQYAETVVIFAGPSPQEIAQQLRQQGFLTVTERIQDDGTYYFELRLNHDPGPITHIVEYHQRPRFTLYYNFDGALTKLYQRLQTSGVPIVEKLGHQSWGDVDFAVAGPLGIRSVYSVTESAFQDEEEGNFHPNSLRVRFASTVERDHLAAEALARQRAEQNDSSQGSHGGETPE